MTVFKMGLPGEGSQTSAALQLKPLKKLLEFSAEMVPGHSCLSHVTEKQASRSLMD